MAWKTEGKIGYLIGTGGQGAAHWDAERVLYQAPNANTQEEIEKVFYLPPGGNPNTDLLLVWRRYWEVVRTLVAGDKLVAIEIDLTDAASDLTISSLEIFTSQQSSSTAGRIHIYHESGIEVAEIIGDSVDSQETRFSLSGYPRTVNNLNITLTKGHKYYLSYNDSTPGNYYPAYFQNENGNYKEFSSGNSGDNPVSNFGSLKAILPNGGGGLTEASMQSILRLNQNEQFAWIGNDITDNGTSIIKQNRTATKQTTAANAPILEDAAIWGTAKDTIFIWHNKSNTQVIQRIYKKTAEAVSGTIGTLNPTGTEDKYLASIFLGVKNNPAVLESDNQHWFQNSIGSLFKLKSQYIVDFDSTTPDASLPVNPQDNHLYYLSVNPPDWHNAPSVYLYNNGTYTQLNKWGSTDLSTYIDITSTSNLAENVSFASQVQDGSAFTRELNLANAEVKTDRKYYVKINGNLYPSN